MDKIEKILTVVRNRDNSYKFLGVVNIIDDIDEKLSIIVSKKLDFKSDNDLFKLLELDLKLIKERIEAYEQENVGDLISKNPELLCVDPNRIVLCKKSGKQFEVDGIISSFITDDSLWKEVEKQLVEENDFDAVELDNYEESDPLTWVSQDMDDVIREAINYEGAIDSANPEFANKVGQVKRLITQIMSIGNFEKDGIPIPNINRDNFIERLITVAPQLSIADVAAYTLNYCDGLEAGVKEIADELAFSQELDDEFANEMNKSR